jgi:hypothetical protein
VKPSRGPYRRRAKPQSVVEKRKANNDRSGKRSFGLQNKVADNDPMQKDSESNYP